MKPILFNTEMVRAILDGRKTVTRRVIKPHYREDEGGFRVCKNLSTGKRWVEKVDWDEGYFDSSRYIKPPYMPGDILYVRETWANLNTEENPSYYYKATDEMPDWALDKRWRPSIRMPKEAARIFLHVIDVYPQPLQEMTENDAIAEGCAPVICPTCFGIGGRCTDCNGTGTIEPALLDFACIWNYTLKKKDLPLYGWEVNPWVWTIKFERVERNAL